MIGPFVVVILFVLTLASDRAVLNENGVISILVASSEKRYSSLKEATIYFYCLLDESLFSDICTIMELKELNWLCKHMKNVRSSQPFISMNFFSKAQVLPYE